MKNFEVEDYIKPSLSKMGIVLSKKNRFFVTSLMKIVKKPIEAEEFPYYRHKKIHKVEKSKKSNPDKTRGTSSFKSTGRKDLKIDESPPLGWYSPNFDFISRKTQSPKFRKPKAVTPEPLPRQNSVLPQVDTIAEAASPRRIFGIPFEKQLKRKSWFISDAPNEKRFDKFPSNKMLNPKKVHSFMSYTPRKENFLLAD